MLQMQGNMNSTSTPEANHYTLFLDCHSCETSLRVDAGNQSFVINSANLVEKISYAES